MKICLIAIGLALLNISTLPFIFSQRQGSVGEWTVHLREHDHPRGHHANLLWFFGVEAFRHEIR